MGLITGYQTFAGSRTLMNDEAYLALDVEIPAFVVFSSWQWL